MHNNLKYVDHTYRDFSRYVETGGVLVKHKKSGNNFPARLHQILSNATHSCVITWMPHGRAWKILDKQRLVSEVLPGYYACKKYESFSRQLNGWGFKRLHQHGPDFGCYYHECFLRDLPKLTCLIHRLPANLGKLTPFPEGEPNFYRISENYPLPPRGSSAQASSRTRGASSDPSRTSAANSDSSNPLAAAALVHTATPRGMSNGNSLVIQHGSSSPVRLVAQDTAAPPTATSLTREAFLAMWSNNPQGQAGMGEAGVWSRNVQGQIGVPYCPTSDQSFSQHPLYSAGNHYDHHPASGQPYQRHPGIPPHASDRVAVEDPFSFVQQQNYSQDSHLNHNQSCNPSSVGFTSQMGSAFFPEDSTQQVNAAELFDPIPFSRQL